MKLYYYPKNLKKKPIFLAWTYKNFGVTVALLVISLIILIRTAFFPPLVLAAAYAFCTIQLADSTVMDFLIWAARYFVAKQQIFYWR